MVFTNGKAVYLGFENPHQGAFTVRILKESWKNFPAAPETQYKAGQRVQVTRVRLVPGRPDDYRRDA